MTKPKLTVDTLKAEAGAFAVAESTHREPILFGVTDGKAIGTYFEHKFRGHVSVCDLNLQKGRRPKELTSRALAWT